MSDDDMLEYGLTLRRRMQWIFWIFGIGPKPEERKKKCRYKSVTKSPR